MRESEVAGAMRGTYERLAKMLVFVMSGFSQLDWNIPVASTEVTEANGLLGRKVNHDETIDTSLLAVL